MLKSLFGVVEDVATVVLLPIEVALDVTKAVTEPLADGARAVAETVKDLTETK